MKVSSSKGSFILAHGLGISIVLLSGTWTGTPAFASGSGVGHSHSKSPATKDEVTETAKKVRDKLISDGKIDASWKDIAPESTEPKDFGKKKEWVVSFKDAKATDKAKETLYLFFSETGNYLAVNFTGK